jgi:cell wall-associated NlpC family hydrolase
MSMLKSVVFVTSAALIATGALTAGSAPAQSTTNPARPAQEASSLINPSQLAVITKSLENAELAPAKTASSLEKQLATVKSSLQDAEAATLEASENAVAADEAATRDRSSTALGGTTLAALGFSHAEIERQRATEIAHTAQSLFDQAETKLNAKRGELVKASADLHGTTVSREQARLDKQSETRGEAKLMATLQAAESDIADPLTDPALAPETLENAQVNVGQLGSAAVATAGIQLSTLTRTARITKSIKWAQSIAKNNKFKYRYGATGPTYFDCSGYVGKAFAMGGKKLNRTSSAQYKSAPKKVSLSKLQKGDLVFWSSNRGRSFYHVAMYVGAGKIAHARNPNAGISVTKLNYAGMHNIYKYAGRY